MSKILIPLAVILVLALGALLAYAATRPDTFRIERSVTITASPEKIHPYINDIRRFNEWTPFSKADPDIKASYRGPASGPGAAYDFDGNAKVGKGSLEIIAPSGPNTVSMRLDMVKPLAGSNLIDFTLQPAGPATRVTWAMHGQSPFIAKLLSVIFDMHDSVGREFDTGLAALKSRAEAP